VEGQMLIHKRIVETFRKWVLGAEEVKVPRIRKSKNQV